MSQHPEERTVFLLQLCVVNFHAKIPETQKLNFYILSESRISKKMLKILTSELVLHIALIYNRTYSFLLLLDLNALSAQNSALFCNLSIKVAGKTVASAVALMSCRRCTSRHEPSECNQEIFHQHRLGASG